VTRNYTRDLDYFLSDRTHFHNHIRLAFNANIVRPIEYKAKPNNKQKQGKEQQDRTTKKEEEEED
jgi:hypothetical protein